MVMKYYYFSVGNTHQKSLEEALAPTQGTDIIRTFCTWDIKKHAVAKKRTAGCVITEIFNIKILLFCVFAAVVQTVERHLWIKKGVDKNVLKL
jgi:hypothetical protein